MIHTTLFLIGAILGVFVNWAVAVMAWNPRGISPWCKAPKGFQRRWFDYLPILGWLGLKREKTPERGRFFWLRPMLVELGMAIFAVWFYDVQFALYEGLSEAPGAASPLWTPLMAFVHYHYAMLMVLVTLMLAASLIDIDERTIPDSLTVLGTLFALVSSVVLAPLLIDTPLTSTGLLGQPPVGQGTLRLLSSCSSEMQEFLRMALALFFWNGWCFAMMNRHWRPNHGWKLAWAIFWKRLARTRSTRYYALLAMVGSGLILFLYRMAIFHSGNEAADAAWYCRWCNFQTALFGMGGAGAMLWAIRVAGFLGMKREALGFGDVTLMAMIGAFLGWRACVVLFLLSPFAALVVGILMVALRRGNEIPYGPFLCLAALVVILSEYSPWFELVSDWLCRVPVDFQLAFALAMFGLMVVLLRLIQWVKKLAGIEA